MSCVFCQILSGHIPSKAIYEDEKTYAFMDINPQAPSHILVIPKIHVADTTEALLHEGLAEACLYACVKAATIVKIKNTGFRISVNNGADACQSVQHLHFHVLGGGPLSEKMA